MRRFYFDLFFDNYVVLDPGGIPFEDTAGAQVAAYQMARELAAIRSELRNGRGWIRLRDDKRHELQRLSIDLDASVEDANADDSLGPQPSTAIIQDSHPLPREGDPPLGRF